MTSKPTFKKIIITFSDSSLNLLQDRPIQILSYLGYFASGMKIFKKTSKTPFFRHFLIYFSIEGRNDKKHVSQPLSAHYQSCFQGQSCPLGCPRQYYQVKKLAPPQDFEWKVKVVSRPLRHA